MIRNPLMLEFPEEFTSERLLIRSPRALDGPELHYAVKESHAELKMWMPWAQQVASIDDCEEYCRQCRVKYLAREDLPMLLFLKGTERIVGASGLHRFDWQVPRCEIGYWIRTSYATQGFATEAVRAITDFAFAYLQARRVEINVDIKNVKSWKVAEKAGFEFEGTLRHHGRDMVGQLRDTKVYSRIK